MQPTQQVIDETGAIHALSRRIGAGGQGEVWLAEGGRRVVKLLNRRADADALRRQFAFVRRLDLAGLHVARPIAVLKPPHVGYVAEFLGDMVPIKAILEAPPSELLRWHIDTGGLRRRLRLLAHAGEALAGLHARGVVYADVSHNNVFISEPVGAEEAWLIDLDNLSHESDPRRAIYTPGYGAPEVVAGSDGCTSLSDAWAFAVLVWQTLTLTHPFVGDLVNDGEPELEEQALAGRLPWVGHSTDPSNACSTGLPPDLVMASRLQDLARRNFEDGLTDRKRRPGIAEWIDRLHAAADQTIRCPDCQGTYFVIESVCPWCDEPRPRVVPVKLARWQPDKGLIEGAVRLGQFPLTAEGIVLPRRATLGLSGASAREAHVRIAPVDRGFSVRAMPGTNAWVAPVAKAHLERHPVSGRGRIVPPTGWMVFFEDPDQPQRVAVLGRTA
jgi:DNA-binding helix-hairpin-helix protein with protein kinase domain